MPVSLDTNHVLLGLEYASKREVIRAIGDLMVAFGEVTPRYVEGMHEKENQCSTWISEGVALPHGTNAVKGEVLRSSIVVAQAPQGVDWGSGKTVHLAIGLAGKGDEQHLKLLSGLARVLQHRQNVEKLIRTRDPREVVEILTDPEPLP
jgi:mannitol/fructose-specific phosphotransferase system IIA component